jgi:hypothetical protein
MGVWYKETLHNSLTIIQLKCYFRHPLIDIKRMLDNQHSTFRMNVG